MKPRLVNHRVPTLLKPFPSSPHASPSSLSRFLTFQFYIQFVSYFRILIVRGAWPGTEQHRVSRGDPWDRFTRRSSLTGSTFIIRHVRNCTFQAQFNPYRAIEAFAQGWDIYASIFSITRRSRSNFVSEWVNSLVLYTFFNCENCHENAIN